MELDKAYEPAKHEAGIYKLWEDSGAFEPSKDGKEPFSIILPPPNANGDLHLGHAMYSVEDIMARHHRMLGHSVLWLPGADHAGIETQVVYERLLEKEGKSRFDLGRDKFYQAVMDFTQSNMKNMLDQLRSLGFSLSWSRFKFTLDDDIVAIVYDTFKRLHDDGLIYRGNRIVNWCTSCLSSFADIEVKYETRKDHMYTLDYGQVKIATTRPETIFADVAVAVNPKDPRYAKLVGQTATVPLVDRPVPIIADEHVDPKTGTGALKVTPGHDTDDFNIGLRHDLPQLSTIDLNGKMINVPEDLLGLGVEEARRKTVALLKAAGSLVKTDSLTHSVGTHGRCGTVIEPLITEQWWLKVESLAEPAVKAFETNEIKVIPARKKKEAINWLKNLRDWNISRQNWWGIRIPVYYKTSNDPSKQPYIIAADEAEAKQYYGAGNYKAETDTFDTWFSSGQWPFATLMATGDFDRFYPTSVMETGRDILFLWVTRMAMLGIYRTGKVPFRTVYLHGMVNDEHGKKMSKSKGNVINPLDMTAKYGTDAVRMALIAGVTPGADGALSEKKIEAYRNFANKLWNVARFALAQLPPDYSPALPSARTVADKNLLHQLSYATASISASLDKLHFSEALQSIYSLLWDDLADWYVETAKVEFNPDVMVYALETVLKLLHPFAPFITEAIWQELPWQRGNLIVEAWPEPGPRYAADAAKFEDFKSLVTAVRAAVHEIGLAKPVVVTSEDVNEALLAKLAGAGLVRQKQGRGLLLAESKIPAWLELDSDTITGYLSQLKKRREDQAAYAKRLENQLSNQQFIKSAPKAVVEDTRDRQAQAAMLISKLDEQIAAIAKS